MDLKGIKIGVLGGGVSAERDISLISAKEVCKAFRRNKLDLVFVDLVTSEKEQVKNLLRSYSFDVVFIALHGEFGEDGAIQEVLEELNICYTGSGPQASSLAMNKALAKDIFKKTGLATPKFYICKDKESLPENLSYPLVVKPCCLGSSLGTSIVRQSSQLQAALNKAFLHQAVILLEEYIPGRELTVGILDEEPLAVVEIIPKRGYFDFDAKYKQGRSEFVAPAKLEVEIYRRIQVQAQTAHKSLGCRHFSRVDIRLSEDNIPYILEVNSIPGLTSHSLLPLSAKACGITFDKLILKMLSLALDETKETQKV